MPNAKKQRSKDGKRLAVRMARDGGISVSRARELEAQLTRILVEGLLNDGQVATNGFGRLEIVERSALVWDPQRGEMVKRKLRRAVRFRGVALSEDATAKSKCLTQRRGDAEGAKI